MSTESARKAAELADIVLRLQACQKKWLTPGGVNAMKPAFVLAADLSAACQTVATPRLSSDELERQALDMLHDEYDDDHKIPVRRVAKFMVCFADQFQESGAAPAVSTPWCPVCKSDKLSLAFSISRTARVMFQQSHYWRSPRQRYAPVLSSCPLAAAVGRIKAQNPGEI